MRDSRNKLSSPAQLYVIAGPMKGHFFPLREEVDTFSVGRTPENDIHIEDGSISSRHLKIVRRGGKFFIEDLESLNGTRLDGDPIQAGVEYELPEGLPVSLGNTVISLNKAYTEDEMVTQFSINVSDEIGEEEGGLLYKDRRIADRGDLELVCELSETLMRSLDINTICEKIMQVLLSRFKRIDAAAILLMDQSSGSLKELVARARYVEKEFHLNYSRTVVKRVIREGKAIMMSDTSHEDEHNLSASIGRMLIKSIMCVPLVSESRIRGVIYAHSISVPQGFRKDDLFLLNALSSPAALAIENALLYSRRMQSEEALRRSEQRYRTLLANIGDMVFTMRPEGHLIFGNPKTESITGYSPEHFCDKTLQDLVAPEFVPLISRQLSLVAAGETVGPFEVMFLHVSGQKVDIELTFTPLRDEKEMVSEILGVARDIGERKRAQELARYKELFDSVAEGVFIFDPEERFVEANDIACEMFGYSKEELLGLKVRDILDPSGLSRFEDSLDKVREERQAGIELDIRTRQGSVIPVDMIFRSISYLGRDSVLSLARDITQTKLLQDQLIRSERLAASGQLAASIAHEINSPLQAIGVLLSRMKNSSQKDTGLSENIDILMHGFGSIRDTVRDLLDLNRPGMEEKRLCNINTVIEKTVALVQGHLKKNRVRVNLHLRPDIPAIKASPQQLGQVFMNLIMNAVQAMSGMFHPRERWRTRESRAGEITIESDLQGERVVVRVTDTGPGISPEDKGRIFDPFYTRKKTMGMGIGLSICYGIIENHHGTIAAGNSPGGGAVFEITLPSMD
jgi:PAS domain S-box-containing protein